VTISNKSKQQDFKNFYQKFLTLTKSHGHYGSIQREAILRVLYESKTHLSADEIATNVRKYARISLHTVYNTLGFLEEFGLIHTVVLPPFKTKTYKLQLDYHDQLVCIKCGVCIPFHDPQIHKREEEILALHDFTAINRTIILYGICATCQKTASKKKNGS